MPEPIVILDSSEIHVGKLDELKAAMEGLARFVEDNEPRPIAYHVYLSDDPTRVTVLQIHPDSASAEFHMDVAASAFSGFAELLRLLHIDVYGTPSDALLERLRAKARMLGGATLAVHGLHAGFTRVGER